MLQTSGIPRTGRQKELSKRYAGLYKAAATLVLIALSVMLPQVFHMVGGANAGRAFLPMHIPVLIAGLLLGAPWGVAAGLLSPLVSHAISGMPAAAILPVMMPELGFYGAVAGAFRGKTNRFFALAAALTLGRLLLAAFLLVSALSGGTFPLPEYVWSALLEGLPGIVLQLAVLPFLTAWLERRYTR
ncbi:MAG: ECF transporter S component [Clostridiales bacterium]|jgi:hypothetical protein|nr:ECF transporter S component [Clostridiales bacterium]